MNPTRKAFILGGTGQIGRAIAETLIVTGWRVTLAHRGTQPAPLDLLKRGAAVVTVNREGPGALARALDSGADALIDVTAYGLEHARQLLDVQHSVGSFVVISSSSVYRDENGKTLDEAVAAGFPELPEPITETQITVAPGPTTYSTRKMALERTLLDEAIKPVTILRPAAIHGPGSMHPREWWFVKRILDGRPVIPIAYRGQSRFHTSATANIAELTRVALDAPGSRVLNIADPSAISVGEIGETIAKYMSYAGRFIRLDGDTFPAKVGQTPWSVPRPFVLDTSAAAALGYVPVTTYAQTVGAICDELADVSGERDWRDRFPVMASYPYDHFDYDSEDAFLSSL
jgi:nucleoside-diphosphate-sugar epimerase